MRTLNHDGKTITVPDDVVDDYTSRGWQEGPTAPSAPKPRRPRKPRAGQPRKPRASQPPTPEPTPEP